MATNLNFFINHALNTCSEPISLNSEIQYLKAIAVDRGYNPSIVNKALFKLQNSCLPLSSHSNSKINIIIPFLPNSRFSLAKILKQHNFKIIFYPNKILFFQVKRPSRHTK